MELHDFRKALERLSDKDFTKAGPPHMKALNAVLDAPITEEERDALWEDHLVAPDDGTVRLRLTHAPANPFTLTVNGRKIMTARIGQEVEIDSRHMPALAAIPDLDFKFI